MAPNIPVGYGQYIIEWTNNLDNAPYNTVIGVEPMSDLNKSQFLDLAFQAYIGTSIDDFHSQNGRYNGAKLRVKLSGPPDVWDTLEDTQGRGGADASQPSPPNVAVLVKKIAELGPSPGRMYLPSSFALDSDVTGGGFLNPVLQAGIQTNLRLWFIALRSFMQVDDPDWSPVVFRSNGLAPVRYTDDVVVDSLVATQRRRLRK